MKIGINSTYLSKMYKTGIENYSSAVIFSLLKNDHENHYRLFSPIVLPEEILKNHPKTEIFISPFTKGWHSLRLPLELRRHAVDLFFDPGYTIPPFINTTCITAVHDLAYKHYPEAYSKAQLRSLDTSFKRFEKRANGLVFTSESTRKDFLKFFPNFKGKTKVIYQSIDYKCFASVKNQKTNSNLITGEYILSVGRLEKRKNTASLVKAYYLFRRLHPEFRHKLVLVGMHGYGYDEIRKTIDSDHNFSNDVIEIGYAKSSDMPNLYSNASLFIFPSLYEGFGIPILEAFATKTPVICSDISSLPEVAGPGALYCDPLDTQDIFHKISKMLADRSIRDELIKNGSSQLKKFDWDIFAQELIKFFDEVYESSHNS